MGAIGGLASGVSTLSGGLSKVGGSLAQGGAAEAQGIVEKQLADTNARLAELNAEDAIKRGDKAAIQKLSEGRQVAGAQKAALAASGVDVGYGSALDVQADTEKRAAEDALTIRNNAWREAWGYKVQALDYRTRGKYAAVAGRGAGNAGVLSAGAQAVATGAETISAFTK